MYFERIMFVRNGFRGKARLSPGQPNRWGPDSDIETLSVSQLGTLRPLDRKTLWGPLASGRIGLSTYGTCMQATHVSYKTCDVKRNFGNSEAPRLRLYDTSGSLECD
jgi:hypothetical protein